MATSPADVPPRPIGHENLVGALDRPVLRFDLLAEIEHLRQQEAWRSGSGPSATTLAKHSNLRVVLIAMRGGEVMPEHRTAARITIHVLSGKLRLRLAGVAEGVVEELLPGHLLVVDRELGHDVEAVEDSALLLTLAWPGPVWPVKEGPQ